MEGNVVRLLAGGRFALEDDPDRTLVCFSGMHSGTFPKFWQRPENEVGVKDDGYCNAFECLPEDVPYRIDSPIERPDIRGVHFATVVAPEKRDVDTDVHGRVRIRFHWDRNSEKGVSSQRMCWARVSQPPGPVPLCRCRTRTWR